MGMRSKRMGLSVLAGTLSLVLSGCLGSGNLLSGPSLDPGATSGQNAQAPGSTFYPGQNAVPDGAINVNGEAGILSGRVQYASSASTSPLPLRSAQVTLDGQPVNYSGGSFTLSGVQPGTHQLTVRAPHFRTESISVSLAPGEGEQITLNMSPIYSASDLDDLARLVRSEAGGEPYVGQVAVAASALNRVLSPRYPNSIPGVVYQAWTDPTTGRKYVQYSPVINGSIWQPATSESRAAVADALAGWDPSHGATGFFNGAKTDNQWVRQQGVTTVIGNHAFFR